MPTCGYVCPSCGGKGYDDEGVTCHWCMPLLPHPKDSDNNQVSKEFFTDKFPKAHHQSDVLNIKSLMT